ncbi:MAG: hypothetical protein K5770_13740, partial [Lachnospiraceae bacterium]|nr:hypothetical protein [Lachnospiraceae bacterium]
MFTFSCPRCGALLRISRRNPNDVYECEYCNALLSGVNAVLDRADGAVSQSGGDASAAKRSTSLQPAENKTAGPKKYKYKKKMDGGSGLLIAVSALFIIAVLSWLFSGRGEVIKSGDA